MEGVEGGEGDGDTNFMPGLTELHVHLDGSLRPETLLELARDSQHEPARRLVGRDPRSLCFQPGWTLPQCLASFADTVAVLQTAEALERVAAELCADLAACGVDYAEVRWCPSLHTELGLGREAAVAAVARGLERGEAAAPGCQFRQILTVLRSLGVDEARIICRLAADSAVRAVVGVDLAGDETRFPAALFAAPFGELAGLAPSLGVTVHAGEGGGAQAVRNVRDAVEMLGATRIGHGCAAAADPALLEMLRRRGVAIEVCPTSNVHTGSVPSLRAHPARAFHDAGIVIVPCCDNAFLSQTDTAKEYAALESAGLFTAAELAAIAAKAREAAFSHRTS